MNTSVQPVKGGILMYPKEVTLNYRETKPKVYQLCHLRNNIIHNKEVIYYASKAEHVPESTMEIAGEALFDAIHYFCANGHAVQVPGLGTFGTQFKTKVAQSEEEVSDERINRKYIRYWPKHAIRALCNMKNISIEVKDILGIMTDDEEPTP